MAVSLRDLRRKIKSIGGTRKLTQAMQMVASSKMQKAVKAAEKSRDYSKIAGDIIQNIKKRTDITQHFLLQEQPLKNVVIIVVTSNRGLCGGLNTQILRKVTKYTSELQSKNINFNFITIGNKGKLFISRYYKQFLLADFPLPEGVPQHSDISALGKMIIEDYKQKKVDHVKIFYNHFVTTLKQEAKELHSDSFSPKSNEKE